ncbi:MAG: regulator, partial [Bacteroidota bacterium]
EVWDFLDIEIHPETEVIYAGAYYDGLIVYDRSEYEVVDNSNSSLTNPPVDSARTRISGLAFDQENNLWVSNFGAEDGAISVLRAEDGQWQKFNPPACQEDALAQVAVDFNNYKWFVSQSTSTGMIVLDAGVLNDPSDDRCRVFTEGNSNLPSNQVNCVEVDLDGDVWIGTAAGTVVFECGPSVFEPECTGSLRIVEQDNFGAFLLETENIRTIAIDGANRKWFGTDNGIFVQSSNGEEQVAFYNVENSPLFDNVINDIAIHPTTGEIYIGTNKGLQSIRGEAVEGGLVNSNEVVVFPNPVRPDYEGVIAINGLAQDANVKITDVHGQLVFEGEAFGGQAIWDGRDYNGRRAATGVYLVFSTSQSNFSNPNTAVAKIMFIN